LKYNAFAITNAYNGHNEISNVNFNSGRRVLANLKIKYVLSRVSYDTPFSPKLF